MARKKDNALHERRTQQILEAARTCFIQHGIHKTSMQQICQQGEISPGALYRYFPSKQSIIEAIAAQEKNSNAELIAYLQQAKDPAKALEEATSEILDQILDQDYARLMLAISAEAENNLALKETFDHIDQEFADALHSIFAQSQKAGLFAKSQPLEGNVFIFLALLDGITARAASGDLPPRKTLEQSMRNALRQLF
ncbi:TetR family transcriptional regulator [Maritalea mobilis]|uniref:TetR family transcriptional regulator n=1 Tax=Maritalea mobilis TaxID=483324 RepID=A0A4R6W3C4_9HYPH|nr:TetR/AcrR family transcriptional regulator [Maritalea mobilis]TDQ67515.1 TetR family transcriptional regulator [Maritalea mobilis]